MRDKHRIVFVAHNGPGPWPCHFCNEPVEMLGKFTVHHLDHDHENDDPVNLSVAHVGCHSGHHHTNRMDIIAKMTAGRTVDSYRKTWETRRARYGPAGGNITKEGAT